MKGLGENCKNICRKHGVEMYFRGGSTIRDLQVHPKDKDTILKKSGVIYRYKCGRVDVRMSTLESWEELLEKDSGNI